jgi:hypothetical protein
MTDSEMEIHIDGLVRSFIAHSEAYFASLFRFEMKSTLLHLELAQKAGRDLDDIPGDARKRLLPLLVHPNAGVRYRAARMVRDLEPEGARAVVESFTAMPFHPLKSDAAMTLAIWDDNSVSPELKARDAAAKAERDRERDANRAAWMKRLGRA